MQVLFCLAMELIQWYIAPNIMEYGVNKIVTWDSQQKKSMVTVKILIRLLNVVSIQQQMLLLRMLE